MHISPRRTETWMEILFLLLMFIIVHRYLTFAIITALIADSKG